MLVAETYLGHRTASDVAARLNGADPHRVVLSDVDRQRSRVRTETADGRDLGVVVAQDLADGDVLEAENGDLVVVELATVDALVLDIDGGDVSATAALELGHALGNRHWEMALRDGEALFPVPDTRERMAAAVADLLPEGVETRFEAVAPTTFDEAGADHDHGHAGSGHDHTHDGSSHDHGVHTVDGGGGA